MINGTTACWPGLSHAEAIRRLVAGTTEPALGTLGIAHIQLCPQNVGVLDEQSLDELIGLLPTQSRLRPHANVRLARSLEQRDAARFSRGAVGYFRRLSELCAHMHAPAYTLHAGERRFATLDELHSHVHAIEDLMGLPVGVEGHYPEQGNRWLISDWSEYRWLLQSGLKYALDLSHLHIVATATRAQEPALVAELLASERCIEIHLSDNSGHADVHTPMAHRPWWWEQLRHANPLAVLFSEGNQRSPLAARSRERLTPSNNELQPALA